MRNLALDSPLLLCVLVVIVGATASLFPFSPVEPVLVGVAAVAPPWLLLPLVMLATVSHMSTKMLVFLGGTRVERAFTGRNKERFERARQRLVGRDRLQQTTLFVSSVTGLPPFYLTTALCGALRMPVSRFLILATTGRAIRFAALIFVPQLFRPATAAAQSPPAAVRMVGSGSQTYVLLSGMVGGTAGFRRIEVRLVAQGNRVISIDPYQLALDSAEVSFDAMSRLVDAELASRGITGAKVVGHSQRRWSRIAPGGERSATGGRPLPGRRRRAGDEPRRGVQLDDPARPVHRANAGWSRVHSSPVCRRPA